MTSERILIEHSEGWSKAQTSILIAEGPKISGDPNLSERVDTDVQKELNQAFKLTQERRPKDFNGDKVSVTKLEMNDDKVTVHARITDYFTNWGLQYAAPKLFEKCNNDFIESMQSELPCALYAACMIITSDNMVVMSVISQSSGFNGGRLTFGFEEQTEVEDYSPIDTAIRGLKEEYGSEITEEKVKVLGFGKPTTMPFVSAYCILTTGLTSEEIIKARENASDKNEAALILAVPVDRVEELNLEEIPSELIEKFIIVGKLSEKATFVAHVANIPRWNLVKKHLQLRANI